MSNEERTTDSLRLTAADAAALVEAVLTLSPDVPADPTPMGVMCRTLARFQHHALLACPLVTRPAESTAVAAVGYSGPLRLLLVRFTGDDGRTYLWFDVPPETYDALGAADSVGRFVNKEIKGRFVGVRVEPDMVAQYCVDGAGNG